MKQFLLSRFPPTLILCTLMYPLHASAQDIGILFTTPEEREYLDLLRQDFLTTTAAANFNIDVIEPPPLILQTEEAAAPVNSDFHLSAIISRPNGAHTIWLNGSALTEDELPTNMSLTSSELSLALLINTVNQQFILKPGQSINTDTGFLQETALSASSINEPLNDADEALNALNPAPSEEVLAITPDLQPAENPITTLPDETTENLGNVDTPAQELLSELNVDLELGLDPNDPAVVEALHVLLQAALTNDD